MIWHRSAKSTRQSTRRPRTGHVRGRRDCITTKVETKMVTPRICPERPELLDGVPMGQYHCGACGCMVLAGVPHPPHDVGCALSSYSDENLEALAADYAIAYAVVLAPDRPPPSLLPTGFTWTWVDGPVEPHWAIRGTART